MLAMSPLCHTNSPLPIDLTFCYNRQTNKDNELALIWSTAVLSKPRVIEHGSNDCRMDRIMSVLTDRHYQMHHFSPTWSLERHLAKSGGLL